MNQYSIYELSKLSKMRAAAREKVFEADNGLREAYEEYVEARNNKVDAENTERSVMSDNDGRFTFRCDECGNVFKAFGKYAKCTCCGEDTNGMVHAQ